MDDFDAEDFEADAELFDALPVDFVVDVELLALFPNNDERLPALLVWELPEVEPLCEGLKL